MNNLVWFRNDLRTQDNSALFRACKKQGKVIRLMPSVQPKQSN